MTISTIWEERGFGVTSVSGATERLAKSLQPAGRSASGIGAVERQFEIRIARDGTWYHQERPIRRLAMVKLFASVLRRAEDGEYWLETPVERGRISVEDAPFVAVEVKISHDPLQIVAFRTNVGDWVVADAAHPIRVTIDTVTGEPSP